MARQAAKPRAAEALKYGHLPVLAVRDAVHFPRLVNTLHVVREPSLKAVKRSLEGDRRVLILSQTDMSVDEPVVDDLVRTGTISEVLQALPMPDGSSRLVLRGIERAKAEKLHRKLGSFWADASALAEVEATATVASDSSSRLAVEAFERVVQLNKNIPPEALQSVAHAGSAGAIADAIAHHLPIPAPQKQLILEELSVERRLESVLKLVLREEQVLQLSSKIQRQVERELGDTQREFYLREQLKVIQNELMTREDRLGETDEYREKIGAAAMPQLALEKAEQELRRLDRMPAATPEGMVVRNYLDCLVSLPWSVRTEDRLDVRQAAELLDRDHFGLTKVKERILDTLAVLQLKRSAKGAILCFVGPPGVGKTSIARSIAEAMGRQFLRISLGGIRDEAEIRGHRRTYVGSMPGRLISGIRQCGTRNPVIVLDEIDKLGGDYRGDPTSALLEALDPEQNAHFSDHYLETPFDLSEAMFIATANMLDTVPSPLRDRMEIIHFPSYTDVERASIAERFLIPKAIAEHGLRPEQIRFNGDAIRSLVQDYTREAGVRGLERETATVCRKVAREVAEGNEKSACIDEAALRHLLGRPRFKRADLTLADQVGAAAGLMVSEYGGDVLTIEVSLMEPMSAEPELRLTGSLGDVMKESASTALTCVRTIAPKFGSSSTTRPFRYDVHVHVPEGAVPKDGPSAGLTIAVALASAYSGRHVRGDIAMTGEITLRGKLLAVGGIRDKVLAAYRAGYRKILLPADNSADLEDVPSEILASLTICAVSEFDEALDIALKA